MDKLITFYASGKHGPQVRADGRGGVMARGWYVRDEHGVAFGPLASEPPAIELTAESGQTVTASWSDETARYHVWINRTPRGAWRIESWIFKNPPRIDGRRVYSHEPAYFPTRTLDLDAKANAHIKAAIRALATRVRLDSLAEDCDTARKAASDAANRKSRIEAIRAAVATIQAASEDDMAAAMLGASVPAASAAELLRRADSRVRPVGETGGYVFYRDDASGRFGIAKPGEPIPFCGYATPDVIAKLKGLPVPVLFDQPCQQQQARHTGVKRPQTAAHARKLAPVATVPKAKLSALCWRGSPALVRFAMVRELDQYRGRQ
jgi:hypothetical protein